MIPVQCMVQTNEEKSTYGDCVRACIASILELGSPDVPHFFNTNDPLNHLRMQEWFADRGEILVMLPIPGKYSLEQVTATMQKTHPDQHYMLWCTSGEGDHSVVGHGLIIAHDPAWYRSAITGPHSSGFWIAFVIVKI